MRININPIARITLSLLGVTLSLVMCAYALKVMPDAQSEALLYRKRTVEALTVQLSSPVMLENADASAEVLDALVELNTEVLSAALRDAGGGILLEAGNHEQGWQRIADGRSTPEYVKAPIYLGGEEIASVEVRFRPLPSAWALSLDRGSLLAVLLFLAVGGTAGYFFVLRRSLRALDPAAVIPDRVRLVMDTLVEGVIILDESQQILLANRAFARCIDVPVDQLLGKRASALNWRSSATGGAPPTLPWALAMTSKTPVTDQALELRAADGSLRTFTVNAAPVVDPQGRVRGVLASLEDVTRLQQQNGELQRTLADLEESRQSVEKSNAELRYLATRDALTGCLNRRAFFEAFESAFEQSRASGDTLCCAMIDIDHFKQVNDKFGHGTGDRVIAFVAETIRLTVRATDIVGRYGGEEYCVVFPAGSVEEGKALLERIREAVIRGASARFTRSLKLTVSAGLAQRLPEDAHTSTLLERADAALYHAKNTGRDRVEIWRPEIGAASPAETATHRRPRIGATGTWRGIARDAGQQTGVHRAVAVAPGDSFREHVTQLLSLASRHSWTAALLRVEFETVGALTPSVAREMTDRVAGLLRRSDTLVLLRGERVAVEDAEGLPSISSLGSSEIGVLLPDVLDISSIGRVVERLVAALSEPVVVNGEKSFVGCAIGISVAPADGEDFDTLMHRAEYARRVMRAGRHGERYAFYQASMTESLLKTMRIESGLRRALERGEFHLVYQPQVDLGSGRVSGFEALLRWIDADGTSVPPDEFIPIAETSGLIGPIGDWVLHVTSVQARNWQLATGESRRIAVNVSAVQVMSAGFATRVARILHAAGVDPRLIELEITETAFMSDLATAAGTLRELRRLGLHIALDDFGTGYSSLSYLKQLPIDTVKIDSRFIKDFNETREGIALVSAIVGMAHGLGIRVVAEGVETHEVLGLLRSLGCDQAQGYVISRPVPVREALETCSSEFVVDAGASGRPSGWRRLAHVPHDAETVPLLRAAGGGG